MKVVQTFAIGDKLIIEVDQRADDSQGVREVIREEAQRHAHAFRSYIVLGKDNSHFLLTTD